MKNKIQQEQNEICIQIALCFEQFDRELKKQNTIFTSETGKWYERLKRFIKELPIND